MSKKKPYKAQKAEERNIIQEALELATALRCCCGDEGCVPECPYLDTCEPIGSTKRMALKAAELLEMLAGKGA